MAGKLNLSMLINSTAREMSIADWPFYPNVDYWYGPYNSLSDAISTLTANQRNVLGQTVGVYVTDAAGNKSIKEYWFKDSTTELSPKGEGMTAAQSEGLERLLATSGTGVTFSSRYNSTTSARAQIVGSITTGNDTYYVYVPSVDYVNGVDATSDSYQSVGYFTIGNPNELVTRYVYAPKPQNATISYALNETIRNYSTEVGTLTVGSKTYSIKTPTVQVTASDEVASRYTKTIATIQVGANEPVQLKAPYLDVSVQPAWDAGLELGKIIINGTTYTFYGPKSDADGRFIYVDQLVDPFFTSDGTLKENWEQILNDKDAYATQQYTGSSQAVLNRKFDNALTDHTNRVVALEALTANHSDHIVDQDSSILDIKENVAGLDEQINSGEGILVVQADHETRVANIENQIENTITPNIESAFDSIRENATNIQQNANDIVAHETHLERLDTHFETVDENIAVNAENIEENKSSIAELNEQYTSDHTDLLNQIADYQLAISDFYSSVSRNGVFDNVNGVLQVQEAIVDMANITDEDAGIYVKNYIPSVQAVYDAMGGLKFRAVTQSVYNELVANNTVSDNTLYFVIDETVEAETTGE